MSRFKLPPEKRPPRFSREAWILIGGAISATLVFVVGVLVAPHRQPRSVTAPALPVVDLTSPVRDAPARFLVNTSLPRKRERSASGAVEPARFSAERDLVAVYDDRVWWESDHDVDDTEDDHRMHRALEIPVRRLIELVCREGGRLKIQDAYRPEGIHAPRSLHREGRAIDVTCDELPLEALAKLCWEAGFDWVYYESPKNGGAHIHCSVRRDHRDPTLRTVP